ncbi:MAG TPA: IPT/TIG domain-containing protein, partial [Bryobacteraceae bacterium]|nr:IPT/TIG domain-containing protein [Bryobacteraceae bacterium]
ELITLFGTGLSTVKMSMEGGQAFPTSLGQVSVSINNIPCPIYYVSPTQISVIVPYDVASNQTGLANIQVTNNGVASNVVQMYLSDSAPGAFSTSQNGIGYAAAVHAATGALISSSDPAQPGEYISLFLTGLGTVSPSISNGALGPVNPLSVSDLYNAGNLSVFFNDYFNGTVGNPGTIEFAGLAPELAGLYQINVQVPTTGLVSGDNIYVEFVTDAADVNQIQIPYGVASSGSAPISEQTTLRAEGRKRLLGRRRQVRALRRYPGR